MQILDGCNTDITLFRARGSTPLHEAAKGGHIGVVRALLDAGARIDARDRDGRSAEDVAAELGRQSVLELLRDARRAKGEL